MIQKTTLMLTAAALLAVGLAGLAEQNQEKKDRKATVTGILMSRTEIKNSKHLLIEILGDGEEKSRRYGVPFLPKEKGPVAEVHEAVQRAKIGDRVFCNLVYGAYGYEGGFTVTSFQVLKKISAKKDVEK